MTRYPDWQTRLDVFLRENGNRKFKYGEWDCGLFVASAIEAMTGVDPAVEWRGDYASDREARASWEWSNGKDISTLPRSHWLPQAVTSIAAHYSMKEIPASRARRGDAVLIKRPKGYSLGLVSLSGIGVIVVAGDRLVEVPFTRIQSARAWRVG